jgi:hypothetical protein
LAARLGHVLYILGLILAGLCGIGGVMSLANAQPGALWIAVIVWGLGGGFYLLGWALRYILAGR